MRRKGELSIGEAAERVEVHHTTMRRWAQLALSGCDSRLEAVRLDAAGRYWIATDDVQRISESVEESNSIRSQGRGGRWDRYR